MNCENCSVPRTDKTEFTTPELVEMLKGRLDDIEKQIDCVKAWIEKIQETT